ncbi:MAG: peptidoglycan DD-metalloendopeptidase family protein [Anaerolineales bacterium]|nr:peptidoglycan DD-metalloendopeptidase family protein [Anaerolineales bacterium]
MPLLGLLLGGFLLTACQRTNITAPLSLTPHPVTSLPSSTATPFPTPTPTQTPTRTPTSTPPPTATPTATALPITVTGDPLAALVVEPVPQPGAVCGFVDYFDFPIDPPDAEFGRGGGDFGIYRTRYQSNHAGEDWGIQNGENLGTPVYVIGHGVVTYSQPYGWGLDQGTVIVKHTFRNGRVVYSFYGHLDPPSVTLRPGTCLARGDTVGNIGDPTGRPHLHFEIRLQNPDTPGPGYWPVDPTLAGWLPPSQTIWENRIESQAGTVWTRVPAEGDSEWVGQVGEMLLVIEEGQLRALDVADGHVIWRQELETNFPSVLLAAEAGLVYVADPLGHLAAWLLPTPEMMSVWNNTKVVLHTAWEQDLGVNGSLTLLPLPGGGVAMALRQMMVAFSPEGARLWDEEGKGIITDWARDEARVVFSTVGETSGVWTVTEAGVEMLAEEVGGQVTLVEGVVFIYASTGLFRVNEAGAVSQIYAFGRGSETGEMIPWVAGGGVIVQPDVGGTRLLGFDAAGALVWERALRGVVGGTARVAEWGGEVFVLTEESQGSAALVYLYQVDFENGLLTEVWRGGTRTASRGSTWIETRISAGMLIQIGGGHQVLFQKNN